MAGHGFEAAGQPVGILARLLSVSVLVAGTYNPSGYSYYHWVTTTGEGSLLFKSCVGVAVLIGYIICVAATWRSLGRLLLIPGLILIASLIWLLWHLDLIDLADPRQRILVLEFALVVVFTAGICFSQIRFRLAGLMDSRTVR